MMSQTVSGVEVRSPSGTPCDLLDRISNWIKFHKSFNKKSKVPGQLVQQLLITKITK